MKKKFKRVVSSIKQILIRYINFIKLHKKQVLLSLGLFLMVFIPTFLYINLTNPTKVNSLIASVVNRGAPSNKYFDDEVFYRAVVDAYNSKNNTSLPYTTNLTDEQLKTITSLSYSGYNKPDSEKIASAKGIEKLISLTYLGLEYNNLRSIDVSENTSLTSLKLYDNNLSSIDVSKNSALTQLWLDDNNLSSIDVSKNTALTSLNLQYNNLSSIDVSKNTSLKYLSLFSNKLSSIDVSKNTTLTGLYLSSNKLSSIDVSKNTALTRLELSSNKLSSIDVSSNTVLTILELSYNDLSSIDLGKNTALTRLELSSNNLSSIDVSKNTALTYLNLKFNNLNDIVLYDKFDTSKLKSIIGTQYSNQININLGNNKEIKPINSYKYYLETKLVIPNETDIDIFKENLGLNKLTAKVYNEENEKTTGQVKQDDILKIYDGETEVDSIKIIVFNNEYFEDDVFYKVVVDAYNNENKTNLPYTTNLTEEQLKTITSLSYSGYNKPNSEKIASAKGIEKLTSLTDLYLSSNDLSSIDVSNNTALMDLHLSSNKLSSIDVSNNTALMDLDLSSNNLSSIDLSKNTSLKYLSLSSNNLSSIDVSKNTTLTGLYLSSNKLSSIDVSKNTALTSLELMYNKLSSIDLSTNTSLKHLYLYDNPLTLEKQRLLKGKSVSSNFISNIKLPEGSDKYFITYEMENDAIAIFSDNKITGLKSGNTNLVATLNGVKESGSSTSPDVNVNGNILVYDLTSSKYNINHDEKYIYIGTDSINSSLDNIKLENISGEIEDNKLVLYDGDIKVDEYRLVGISSSTYDLSNEYIYTGTNAFDKSKITCINCTLEESNNTLNIKYGSTTLKSYKIVSYSSSAYDLSKDYIYTGTNTFDKSKITCINCTLEESNNTLNIKYGSTTLKSYKLVSISSNKYDLSKDNIRLNKDEAFDINSVSVINGTKEYSNNKLYIKYNNGILKVYNIIYRLKGDVNNDGKITNADVSKLFAYYKGKIKLAEDDLSVSDLNNDGKITNADVSKLFAYYKGKIKEL